MPRNKKSRTPQLLIPSSRALELQLLKPVHLETMLHNMRKAVTGEALTLQQSSRHLPQLEKF